jgi:hypothetical protein
MGALTYTKQSSPEWYIGRFVEGGYYIGDFAGYRIILAPLSSQSGILKWQDFVNFTSATSVDNGLTNTNALLALAGTTYFSPAADYCGALTTNDYTDWFMPAKNQLNLMFTALPVLINIGEASISSVYLWTSTQSTTQDAWIQFFRGPPYVAPNGQQSETKKDFGLGVTPKVRAIRQVPI